MKDSFIYKKSLSFGVRCIRFYQHLKEKGISVVSKQLLRSGTSIGANVRESRFAQSPADFVSKLSIALKEAEETQYWLELMYQSNIISDKEYQSMNNDVDEIISLLVSSIKTYKTNTNSKI